LYELDNYHRAWDQAEHDEQQAQSSKECQRLVVPDEAQDRVQDHEPVLNDTNLRETALGTWSEANGNFCDAVTARQCLNGQLHLGLEAAAEDRDALHEFAAKRAIARKNVRELDLKNEINRLQE